MKEKKDPQQFEEFMDEVIFHDEFETIEFGSANMTTSIDVNLTYTGQLCLADSV